MCTNTFREVPTSRAFQGVRSCGFAGNPADTGTSGIDKPPEIDRVPLYFEYEHRRLDAEFHEHLLDIAGGSFILARQHVQRWRHALARHIRIEDTQLLPHIPDGARWTARLYRLEHIRIGALADAYVKRVDAVSENPPHDERSRRAAILALLDAAQPLRHLLGHHHRREEMALAMELPAALQEAAWGYRDSPN